jgi:HAS barrel domain
MTTNGIAYQTQQAHLIGEVVESGTTEFLAQALELDSAPPFGAFVEVATDDNLTVYGVVAQVQTAGIDPGSKAIMRGHGDVRDERIYQENPDLPLVLRTTFRALVVGFADGDKLYQFLPPRPPRLHYSVFTSPAPTVRNFATRLGYLQAILNGSDVPVDELLAANLRYTSAQYLDGGSEFLQQAGRELAQLLRADYARLTAILRRCLAPIEAA